MRVAAAVKILTLFPTVCFLGVSTSNIPKQPRIVGGTAAREGEFPYHVGIFYNGEFVCSGALVKVKEKLLVITAAHCVEVDADKPEKYAVVAGDLNQHVVSNNEQRKKVQMILKHEGYRSSPPVNDIAILKTEPFTENEYVSPIGLPKQGQSTAGKVIITGWGKLGTFFGRPETLQKVMVETMPDAICSFFVSLFLGHGPPASTLCTRVGIFGGNGFCQGDNGGPLKAVNEGYLAGIASYNPTWKCAAPLEPSVSTEVSHFVSWIKNMGE